MRKLGEQRDLLRSAIQEHERRGPLSVARVPILFFEDLHRELQRILGVLGKKIEETEGLARAVFS